MCSEQIISNQINMIFYYISYLFVPHSTQHICIHVQVVFFYPFFITDTVFYQIIDCHRFMTVPVWRFPDFRLSIADLWSYSDIALLTKI